MATIVVTNLTTADVFCTDLYTRVPASGSVTTTRTVPDLGRMASLQSLVAAGTLAVAVTYSAAEQQSGLVNEGEVAVSQGNTAQSQQVLRFPFTAGAGGAPDDQTLFALNSLPYNKMRVLDMVAYVSTAVGGSTLQLRTAASGGGTLLAQCAGTPTGRNAQTTAVTATAQVTNSSSVGLFLHRSDSGIAGEVVITFEWNV